MAVCAAAACGLYAATGKNRPLTVSSVDAVRGSMAPAPLVIRSVEGGVQTGGYKNGRPVASGSDLPVIIRWQPRDEAEPGGSAQTSIVR